MTTVHFDKKKRPQSYVVVATVKEIEKIVARKINSYSRISPCDRPTAFEVMVSIQKALKKFYE